MSHILHRHVSRTALAIVLTTLAVAVPAIAWYIAGSGAAEREATETVRAAREAARNQALRLAERLAGRLEAIRYAESRRPVYHYEHTYHDPTSTCACASLTPSPLAHGPFDPFIQAHFQIDATARLSVPTVHAPAPGRITSVARADRAWEEEQVRIAAKLAGDGEALAGALGPGGEHGASEPGELEWRTVLIAGDPELVAMRRVPAPGGDLIQGIVIATDAVRDLLRGSTLPASFLPGEPSPAEADRAAIVPIECVTWRVSVDAEPEIAAAETRARSGVAAFRRRFFLVTGFAAVAGLLVIGLVWQTDRLAHQRSRFAAAAAHELRTPLAGLRLRAEMLAEGLGDPARARSYAQSLAAESERLGRVVANVLDFARLERTALAVNLVPGDLALAVRECLERLAPAFADSGARIAFAATTDLPPVRFDRDALFHMLQNLLDNAEKYTREAADRTIEVHLARDGQRAVALTVADHGPGVPPPVRRHLFRPFRGMLDPNSPAGLGLGLTLVASLAAAHGGSVTLADTPGGGASFTITLPAADLPPPGAGATG